MTASTSKNKYGLAVRAVIKNDNGECLVLKRRDDTTHFPSTWEWPGGKTEAGESFDQALVREVAQETGLQISLMHVVGAYQFLLGDLHVAVLCMEAEVIGGELAITDEHVEYRWVRPYDILALELNEWFREFLQNELAERVTQVD